MAAESLLSWYEQHRRDLPWRLTDDPYAVWVSEIMLQQTRVDTVLPRYENFLRRFPNVGVLASAPLEEVLAEWSGLGYYRRARMLHRAAGMIVKGGGRMPQTLDGWRALPGVGDYTAAAICSIVYGIAEPVLDGNVARVVSRLERIREGMGTAASRRRLRARARKLIDAERPGDSNQALMELGATVCTPRAPSCLSCPLSEGCEAFAEGQPEIYPSPRRRRAVERVHQTAVVVQDSGKVLLFKRPVDERLMPGLWELPNVERALKSAEEALGARYGGTWSLGEPLAKVRHAVTHRALEIEIRRGEYHGGEDVEEGPEAGWFDADARSELPLSSLVEKILKTLRPTQSSTDP